MTTLAQWANFYVIVGSSAGALIGLQFVVMTLVSHRQIPVLEDWLFHVLMPFAAYALLTISAFSARSQMREALFGVGAAALLLLFVGIHNAWDATTYHVFARKQSGRNRT